MMLVSIIVATYNSAKTLRRCLDSIVPQLGEDCELLVIDGGSKDGTVDIIEEYRGKISYTVSEPDKGVYDAWNKAIVKAKGQWITFIGSDDQMLQGTIDKYRSFLNENGDDYDLISAKLHYISKEGKLIKDVGEPFNWEKLVNVKLSFAHPGMLHNKTCFERFGLFDINYRICGDSDFLQRLGKDVKVGFIDDYLVNMTEGGLSDSTSVFKEGFQIRKKNHSMSRLKLYLLFGKLYIGSFLGQFKKRIKR